MFFFTFAVYLELFERVRSCFGVGYTLRCRIRVLNYNYAAATRCVSIDTQGVDRTDYELFIVSPIKQHAACCFRIITGIVITPSTEVV